MICCLYAGRQLVLVRSGRITLLLTLHIRIQRSLCGEMHHHQPGARSRYRRNGLQVESTRYIWKDPSWSSVSQPSTTGKVDVPAVICMSIQVWKEFVGKRCSKMNLEIGYTGIDDMPAASPGPD
jgi:hypothetical protein